MQPARNTLGLVLDLARRLAEEFDMVPLPIVSRTVKAAAEAAGVFGGDVATSIAAVEQLAREDLAALRDVALTADHSIPA